MSSLSNVYPKDSYKGLLNLSSTNVGLTATMTTVQDGLGNASTVQMSTLGLNITSGLQSNGTNIDYFAGSWTPSLDGGTSTGTPIYATNGQAGRYVKMGNLVWVSFRVALGATGVDTGTKGNVRIGGLPYTPSDPATMFTTPGAFAISNVELVPLTAGYSQFMFRIAATDSRIRLEQTGSSQVVAEFTASTALTATGVILTGAGFYVTGLS